MTGKNPANFFPQRPTLTPAIYAYEDSNSQYAGLPKVGNAVLWTVGKWYTKYR